jgi:glycosyltransferase involved in cell wall biosynthesis
METPTSSASKKIRIVALANSMLYENQVSGGDRIFVEVSKKLNQKLFDIMVITTTVGENLWKKSSGTAKLEILPATSFEKLLSRAAVPLVYLVRSLFAFVFTYKLALASDSVILYSSSDFFPDTIPAFMVKLLRKNTLWISRVYHMIPAPSKREGKLFLNLLSFASQRLSIHLMKKKSDLVVGLNSVVHQELAAIGVSSSRLAISGAGIDIDYIDSVDPGEERYDGVFLGRIHPNKGIFDALEVWRLVVNAKKDAMLAIIGGGPKEVIASLTKRIHEFKLERNVDYLGFLEKDSDVYRILKSSKLFIFTDHEGGWSLATCEAMACGLPTVGYNLRIFGSIFKKGFVIVPLFDCKEFATQVLLLLKDANMRLKLQQEARQQAELFSWRQVAESFSQLVISIYK